MAITLDGNNVSTVGVINSATAQASTSGTSIDFTGIPSGVKRITVMFNGVSTSGTSAVQVQIGSGSVTTTGYVSSSANVYGSNSAVVATATTGFIIQQGYAASTRIGHMVITTLGSNVWVSSHTLGDNASAIANQFGGGNVTLSGTLDRVRITTVNGTDTFDAGSINILYE